jgi:hypothetical protein
MYNPSTSINAGTIAHNHDIPSQKCKIITNANPPTPRYGKASKAKPTNAKAPKSDILFSFKNVYTDFHHLFLLYLSHILQSTLQK